MLWELLLVYVLTIIVMHAWLWIFPKHGPMFFGERPHHYVYGLVIAAFSLLLSWPFLLAIGAALVVDDIPLFFIFRGPHWPSNCWKQYQSWQSILGVAAISLAGFALLFYGN